MKFILINIYCFSNEQTSEFVYPISNQGTITTIVPWIVFFRMFISSRLIGWLNNKSWFKSIDRDWIFVIESINNKEFIRSF